MPVFKGRSAYRVGSAAREAFEAGAWEGYDTFRSIEVLDGEDRSEAAYEVEMNARQFAGHPTYDLRTEAEWEAYEAGVSSGIAAAASKHPATVGEG